MQPNVSGAKIVRKIQLKEAKARLSAVVEQATRGKPSVITRHGKPQAVVLGFADWERLSQVPSFGRLLMSAPLEPGDFAAAAPHADARCRPVTPNHFVASPLHRRYPRSGRQ
jgi:antitoxin Phd